MGVRWVSCTSFARKLEETNEVYEILGDSCTAKGSHALSCCHVSGREAYKEGGGEAVCGERGALNLCLESSGHKRGVRLHQNDCTGIAHENTK